MKNWNELIKTQIDQLKLTGKKFILAVSGGADSMVLLHIFTQLNYPFSVAHVNYHLRGADAIADEKLVKEFCATQNIPFHLHSTPNGYPSESKLSLQEWAREVRYNFFKKLIQSEEGEVIVFGHHKNDQVETFFNHLLRGSGSKGLSGIKQWNPPYFRPLLKKSKEDIYKYAEQFSVPFREDKSNQKADYQRNKIRLELIPLLKEISPSAVDKIFTSQEILQKEHEALHHFFQKNTLTAKRSLQKENTPHEYQWGEIKALTPNPENWFHYLLSGKGFHHTVMEEMAQMPSHQNESKRFIAHNNVVEFHQSSIYLYNEIELEKATVSKTLNTQEDFLQSFGPNEEVIIKKGSPQKFNTQKIYLDLDQLEFPMQVRTLQQGDKIQPLGMKGKRLLSDMYIDKKLPYWKKLLTPVYETKGRIFYIKEVSQAEWCKITSKTQNYIEINLHPIYC